MGLCLAVLPVYDRFWDRADAEEEIQRLRNLSGIDLLSLGSVRICDRYHVALDV